MNGNRWLLRWAGKRYAVRAAWCPTVQWRLRWRRQGIYLGLTNPYVVVFALDLWHLGLHVARRIG